MKKFQVQLLLTSLVICSVLGNPAASEREDPLLNWKDNLQHKVCPDSMFTDIISKNGYPFEAYDVVTEDQRILRLFRIQAKGTQITGGKRVVYLQHGLFDSADSWVINGDDNSLGLVLANKGFDVWLGNSRGNKYSLNVADPKIKHHDFWNHSFQEMGRYDVPANIKFILDKTGQEKLTYIGHSQGTTQMFAALTDPETRDYVNSKVEKFIALAPIVYLSNQTTGLFNVVAELYKEIRTLANIFEVYNLFPGPCSETSAEAEFQAAICKLDKVFCSFLLSFVDTNPKYDNTAQLSYFMKHMPSGSSLKCLYHYGQFVNMKSHTPVFRKYDYGVRKNKKIYGQKEPPVYDLSGIKVPVSLHIGIEDHLGDLTDNGILQNELNKVGVDPAVYVYPDCGHLTFMWAKDASDVFRDVLDQIGE